MKFRSISWSSTLFRNVKNHKKKSVMCYRCKIFLWTNFSPLSQEFLFFTTPLHNFSLLRWRFRSVSKKKERKINEWRGGVAIVRANCPGYQAYAWPEDLTSGFKAWGKQIVLLYNLRLQFTNALFLSQSLSLPLHPFLPSHFNFFFYLYFYLYVYLSIYLSINLSFF